MIHPDRPESTFEEARDALYRFICNADEHLVMNSQQAFADLALSRIDDLVRAIRADVTRSVNDDLAAHAALKETRTEIELFPGEEPLVLYGGHASDIPLLLGWIRGVREQRDGRR